MSIEVASITSTDRRKVGIREKVAALKHKASLSTGDPTDPAFENSFGHQLSDLDGRRRWVLVGLALQKWHQDIRDRVVEVLRENEGEIYKGRNIRGPATLHHCWMIGYDRSCAHPTVVLSCDQSTILKRTMRAISQHGVLKAAKFALKGVPFCDLKLRTEPRDSAIMIDDEEIDEDIGFFIDDPSMIRRFDSDDPWTRTQPDVKRRQIEGQGPELYEDSEQIRSLAQGRRDRSPGSEPHDVQAPDPSSFPVNQSAHSSLEPQAVHQEYDLPTPLQEQFPTQEFKDISSPNEQEGEGTTEDDRTKNDENPTQSQQPDYQHATIEQYVLMPSTREEYEFDKDAFTRSEAFYQEETLPTVLQEHLAPQDTRETLSQDGQKGEETIKFDGTKNDGVPAQSQPRQRGGNSEESKQDRSRVQFDQTQAIEDSALVQHDFDTSDDDDLPLRFGAEEIIVPQSGRPTTLGGFLIVDDVCFGLTTAHAFTEEDQLEQKALPDKETEIHLYDEDWANESSSDDEGPKTPDPEHSSRAVEERQLQRRSKKGPGGFYTDGLPINLSVLKGLQVGEGGEILGADGDPVGQLDEGDPEDLIGKEIGDDGEILDEDGDVIGRAIVLPEKAEELQSKAKEGLPGVNVLDGLEVGKGGDILGPDRTPLGYESSKGEALRIMAKSRLFKSDGIDWALCELGDWGKFALNGVYLPPELRGSDALEYLLFKQIKSSPPLGRVIVATRRGAIPGIGTGSDSSIKLGGDNRYRHVWSVQLEKSLSSGDSGSWVVDAVTGDVYGIIIAGSSGMGEEYVIPAHEIGHDIRQVLRADTVRLPTLQDIMAARTRQVLSDQHMRESRLDALGWESEDSEEALNDNPLDEEEKRHLLAEILKHSEVNADTIVDIINNAQARPKWTKMSLPRGRSLKVAQKAVDHLLSKTPIKESTADGSDRERRRPHLRHDQSYIREASTSTERKSEGQSKNDETGDGGNTPPFEEPPELLDSNPSFRAEMSRRAWRAKRRADQGQKPHHRRHRPRKKSGETMHNDPILKAPGVESKSPKDQSKLEGDLASKQSRDDPDIIIVKHQGSTYLFKFAPTSLANGILLVGDLRDRAAKEFGVEDATRVTLVYKGKSLKIDTRPCREENLKMRSEVLCVIKRTPSEELAFLTNKLRTDLIPQGLEFISNTPDDAKRRDFEYNKISETILTQILMKSDAIDTEGDEAARMMRKDLIKEANGFLETLDLAAKKDSPSNWHADFLEPKQSGGSRSGRPPTTESFTRPSGLKIRRSSTWEDYADESDLDE